MLDTKKIRERMYEVITEKLVGHCAISDALIKDGQIEINEMVGAQLGSEVVYELRKTLLRGMPYKRNASRQRVFASWWSHFLDCIAPKGWGWIRRFIKSEFIETQVTIYNVCPHHDIQVNRAYGHVHYSFLDEEPRITYPNFWDNKG